MFTHVTARRLDEEHADNLALFARLEPVLARSRPGAVDAAFGPLAGTLARSLAHEVTRHFEFEEQALFPRLAEAGDTDLVALLTEEHAAIQAVAADILPGLRAAAAGTLDDDGFARLKPGVLELCERLSSHIAKETSALLPSIEQTLDEDTDRELAFAYAGA